MGLTGADYFFAQKQIINQQIMQKMDNIIIISQPEINEYYGYSSILSPAGARVRRMRRTQLSAEKINSSKMNSASYSRSQSTKRVDIRSPNASTSLRNNDPKLSLYPKSNIKDYFYRNQSEQQSEYHSRENHLAKNIKKNHAIPKPETTKFTDCIIITNSTDKNSQKSISRTKSKKDGFGMRKTELSRSKKLIKPQILSQYLINPIKQSRKTISRNRTERMRVVAQTKPSSSRVNQYEQFDENTSILKKRQLMRNKNGITGSQRQITHGIARSQKPNKHLDIHHSNHEELYYASGTIQSSANMNKYPLMLTDDKPQFILAGSKYSKIIDINDLEEIKPLKLSQMDRLSVISDSLIMETKHEPTNHKRTSTIHYEYGGLYFEQESKALQNINNAPKINEPQSEQQNNSIVSKVSKSIQQQHLNEGVKNQGIKLSEQSPKKSSNPKKKIKHISHASSLSTKILKNHNYDKPNFILNDLDLEENKSNQHNFLKIKKEENTILKIAEAKIQKKEEKSSERTYEESNESSVKNKNKSNQEQHRSEENVNKSKILGHKRQISNHLSSIYSSNQGSEESVNVEKQVPQIRKSMDSVRNLPLSSGFTYKKANDKSQSSNRFTHAKRKSWSTFSFNDVAQNIEEHNIRIAHLYFFIENTKKCYPQPNLFQRYERLCFLLLKKYFYEYSNMIKALKGGINCFHLTSIQVPNEVLKLHLDRQQLKNTLQVYQQQAKQVFKELSQMYQTIHKKYPKDKYIKLQAPIDNFSKQIMSLMMDELTKKYQMLLEENYSNKEIDKAQERIIEIMQIMFLISQLKGRNIKQFQLVKQGSIDFDAYYQTNYEPIIQTMEYFDRLPS